MRIKLTLSYDGTAYCGWQVQPNGITVQEVVENAVMSVTGEKVRVTGSGRTDAGVHAQGQVAHFDTESTVPPHKFYKALNGYLPQDVKILKSEQIADDFHACNTAKKKTYEYTLYCADTELPLIDRYAVKLEKEPDLKAMQQTAKEFLGEHDFKAFSATGSSVKTTVRTIYDIAVIREEEKIKIRVTGNGFLYNMVRIMVGAILGVGNGELTVEDVKKALATGERAVQIKTLSAKGLCLIKVEY